MLADMIEALYGRVFVLGTYQRGGALTATPLSIRHRAVSCGPSVQVTQLLSGIWVPSIISQKTLARS